MVQFDLIFVVQASRLLGAQKQARRLHHNKKPILILLCDFPELRGEYSSLYSPSAQPY
jgi:hypothetical protein